MYHFKLYSRNISSQVGDRVGVVRKSDGTVTFFVNGIDQGSAASNVPELVYGVIDLYGQAAQATIIDHTGKYSELHLLHLLSVWFNDMITIGDFFML